MTELKSLISQIQEVDPRLLDPITQTAQGIVFALEYFQRHPEEARQPEPERKD